MDMQQSPIVGDRKPVEVCGGGTFRADLEFHEASGGASEPVTGREEDVMQRIEESKDIHRGLSQASAEFLEFVESNPECLETENFRALEELEPSIQHDLQIWPTFVRQDLVQEGAEQAIGLCRLVKTLPERVFENDAEQIGTFYGLDSDASHVAVALWKQKDWQKGLLARPDFIHTADGFRCLECNVVGNIGGWEGWYWSEAYTRIPLIRQFLDQRKIEPRCTHMVRELLTHIVRQGLRKFRRHPLNIVFLVREREARPERLIELVAEEYETLVEKLGISAGRVTLAAVDEVEIQDGQVWVEGSRVHAAVEMLSGPSSASLYQAWARGKVLLFNGPFTSVLTDKRNLALLSELQDSPLFDAEEQEVIRTTVPWTRLVSESPLKPGWSTVTPEGLCQDREHLVLKPSAALGGQGVLIGGCTEPEAWAQAVDEAFTAGDWIVQERVHSQPYVYYARGRGPVPHNLIFAFFVFGERFGGGLLRLAPQGGTGVVNVTQQAVQGTLFEVDL